jgi:hypothetical protein
VRRPVGFLDTCRQIAVRLFGHAQLANVVPAITA